MSKGEVNSQNKSAFIRKLAIDIYAVNVELAHTCPEDFFTMKSQLVGHLTLVLFVLMPGYMGSSMTLLGINIVWFIALMSSNIFMIQEKNSLNRLYGNVFSPYRISE